MRIGVDVRVMPEESSVGNLIYMRKNENKHFSSGLLAIDASQIKRERRAD